MGKNRNAAEQVDEVALTELLKSLEDAKQRLKVSDTHDRIATIVSDLRDGTEKYLARYDANSLVESYPVHQAQDETQGMLIAQATAAADDTIQPNVGVMYDIYAIYLEASVLAAGREANVNITDGVYTVPIWQSGIGAIASGAAYLIWPVDVSTLMTGAVDLIGLPPYPIRNNQYILLDGVGLAAAETITITCVAVQRNVGGLRT